MALQHCTGEASPHFLKLLSGAEKRERTVPGVPLGRPHYTEAVAPPCAELGVIYQLKVLTAPTTPT